VVTGSVAVFFLAAPIGGLAFVPIFSAISAHKVILTSPLWPAKC